MVGGTTQVLFDWLRSQPVILLLLVLSIADVISGIAAAFITHSVSSDLSLKGMTKKALMWMVIGVCGAIDHLSGQIPVTKLVAGFYCFTEGFSLIENLGRAGVPIPPILRETFTKLNQDTTTTTTTTTATTTATTTTAVPVTVEATLHVGKRDETVTADKFPAAPPIIEPPPPPVDDGE